VIGSAAGEYDAAEKLLRAALRAVPTHDRVMVKLADLLLDERGDTDEARRLYRRAIALNPAGRDVLYSYGLFLLQVERNMTEAEDILVRGVRVAPLSVPMNWAYGQFLLEGKKRRDQAKDSFEWVTQQESGAHRRCGLRAMQVLRLTGQGSGAGLRAEEVVLRLEG
jgi:Tfp pilus assembly protein PilF